MKQTTEQQNTLREPERGVVDWVGWLRNTTTRVVVQHQFWHGAREWNERNHYAPVNGS